MPPAPVSESASLPCLTIRYVPLLAKEAYVSLQDCETGTRKISFAYNLGSR